MRVPLAAFLAAGSLCFRHASSTTAWDAPVEEFGTRSLVDTECDALYNTSRWTSNGGEVRFHGRAFHIRGTSWFGLETGDIVWNLLGGGAAFDKVVNGTSTLAEELRDLLDVIADQGFNAIRMPLAVTRCLQMDTEIVVPGNVTVQRLMRIILDGAAARGLVVLLDMHRVEPCCARGQAWWAYEVWNPTKDWIAAWLRVLDVFGEHPAVFGLDLFNEPHGIANWGMGGPHDWYEAATELIETILEEQSNYTGLFFVEGVETNTTEYPNHNETCCAKFWWGQNFDGVWELPMRAGGNRVVYSPHFYGPTIAPTQTYFIPLDFPDNLPAIWDNQIGWVENRTRRAVVVGEWGGRNDGADAVWQKALSDYMVENCINDNFYWCVNPTSGDTQGWMDSAGNIDQSKIDRIVSTQPYPSRFLGDLADGFCLMRGQYANPSCDPTPAPSPAPTPSGGFSSDDNNDDNDNGGGGKNDDDSSSGDRGPRA